MRQGDEPKHRLVHHLVHLETLGGDAGVVAVHREAQLPQGLQQLGLVSHLVGKCAVVYIVRELDFRTKAIKPQILEAATSRVPSPMSAPAHSEPATVRLRV